MNVYMRVSLLILSIAVGLGGCNSAMQTYKKGVRHFDAGEYNLALGQKRAEAVAKSLELLGVSGGQIEAVSFGKERPAVQGNDEAAWARNRRAELKDR